MEDVLLIYFEQIPIFCIEIQTHSRYFVKTYNKFSLNSAIYTDRVISRFKSWKFYPGWKLYPSPENFTQALLATLIHVLLLSIWAGISSWFKSRNIAIGTRDTSGPCVKCVLLLLNENRISLLNESCLVGRRKSCEFLSFSTWLRVLNECRKFCL